MWIAPTGWGIGAASAIKHSRVAHRARSGDHANCATIWPARRLTIEATMIV